MNNLEKFDRDFKNNYQSFDVYLLGKKLPQELSDLISSYIMSDITNIQSTRLVCKDWHELTIETLKREKYFMIKNFSKYLANNFPYKLANVKEKLLNICNEREIFQGVNLFEVKSSLQELKESLIDILKDLEREELDKLEMSKKMITYQNF